MIGSKIFFHILIGLINPVNKVTVTSSLCKFRTFCTVNGKKLHADARKVSGVQVAVVHFVLTRT